MDLQLRGKVAIVGGASQGLGYAMAEMLAGEGVCVAMVARRREALEAACAVIAKSTGSRTLPIAADIRRGDDCARIIEEAAAGFGRIDFLINNDGAPPLGALETFDDAAWDKAISQNLMSVVRLSRGVLPFMKSAGMGRIINITALSALQPIVGFGLSVATWAGVLGYAKTLSLEAGPHGITVNTICPGRFATGRVAKVYGAAAGEGGLSPKALADMTRDFPIPRLGDPRELASLAAYLCSPLAGYLTGHVFHMDGGRRASLF